MKTLKLSLIFFALLRFVITILLLLGILLHMIPFSMFSVPFLLAFAYNNPMLAFILLTIYLVMFILSVIFLLFRKTAVLGCFGFAILCLADTICFITSFFAGTNNYLVIGTTVCIAGMFLAMMYGIKTHFAIVKGLGK